MPASPRFFTISNIANCLNVSSRTVPRWIDTTSSLLHTGSRGSFAFRRRTAATRKKNTYLQAQFFRLKARQGPKKALIAVVASILTIVYHMLRDGTCLSRSRPRILCAQQSCQAR